MIHNLKLQTLVVFLFIFSFTSFASNVVLQGNAKGMINKEFKIEIVRDFITYTREEIAKGSTDSKGDFRIVFDLNKVYFGFINFGKVQRTIYLEPGQVYKIEINPIKFRDGLLNDIKEVNIIEDEKTLLNKKIHAIDSAYSSYLERYKDYTYKEVQEIYGAQTDSFLAVIAQNDIIDNPHSANVDDISRIVELNAPGAEHVFLNNYKFYRIGSIEQLLHKRNTAQLHKKYFINKPYLPEHIEYMAMFKNQFRSYLKVRINDRDGNLIRSYLNNCNYEALMNELYQNPYGKSKSFNELILLYLLFEEQNNELLDQKSTIKLLKLVIENSEVEINKVIANNILMNLNQMTSGVSAPNFELYDGKNDLRSLEEFKGKFVYLAFWYTWDLNFKKELSKIRDLQNRYKEDLIIITISQNREKEEFNEFVDECSDCNWISLHYGNEKDIVNDYEVTKDSDYFLIDPEGKFLEAHTKRPSYIEDVLLKYLVKN